ncbi:MAG: HPr(Ser) kinase/phosphatase [Ignavibacteria bacterium]|nr:HPr(Ser) kinase/phosphatase [Ignavibacteria bacterium]
MPLSRATVSVVKEFVTVEELLQCPIPFNVLTGDIGLQNKIVDKSLHRPQLALAGYTELFTHHRVQMFGNTEFFYLESLPEEQRKKAFAKICEFKVPCMVWANGRVLPDNLAQLAADNGVAILATTVDTTKAIQQLGEFLDDQFAEQVSMHGSFVDVYGVGMFLVGKSGIGKSEISLDLLERGHRLVADDVTVFTKKRESILMGTGTSLVRHFMEIRGVGVIDVQQMFGIRSIRFQKRLEMIVELEVYASNQEYNRTGLDEKSSSIMGIDIQTVMLPIFPGKNVTVICEAIALNYLLKTYGYNASKIFSDRLQDQIDKRSSKSHSIDQRHVSYFQSDDE